MMKSQQKKKKKKSKEKNKGIMVEISGCPNTNSRRRPSPESYHVSA
jgi:hypothetical protein